MLQICKKQLDWAPAEMPAKIAGLGTSRNMPNKIAGLGASRNTPGKIAGLGTSRNYSILVIGKQQASGPLFSGELLETGGIYNLTPAKNSWIGHQQKRLPELLDWAPAETRPVKLLDWAPAETIQFELLENSRPLAFARF